MTRMARLQEAGLGVEQNLTDARALYQRAADLKFPAAMRRLAKAYQYGELGLAADALKAEEWRQQAEERSARPAVDPFQI
jgi:TPR repeat protein